MSIKSNVVDLGVNQNITVAGASAATSNAFGPGTTGIRVATTTAAYVTLAAAPVATSANVICPAGSVSFFAASPGQKLAALQVTAGGVLSVTEF